MTSYAAIRISRDTMMALIASVRDAPAGEERLAWALFKYPYEPGVDYYFVGGNYLGLNYPDYTKQILTKTQLDLLFTYKISESKNGRPNPMLNWFVIRERKTNQKSPDIILDDAVPTAS